MIEKKYFCDGHDESNVVYRKKFVTEYLQHEKRTYRWVHIEEHVAIELEKNKELLEDIGVKFEKNNKKCHENHVDTHPMFALLPKKMSIQVQSATMLLMIIGQYESVFKQYSFSKKCWVGPDGITQLLPKSDRYSRMVSAFVSWEFGVGLELTENKLKEVNKRTMSDQWGEYISVELAKNVYRTTKKRFKTNLLLADS